jgi:hypothetical protein
MKRMLIALILTCTLSASGFSQEERIYQSARVVMGKEMRLTLFARVNRKDCKLLPLPEIRVVAPPKNGSFIVKNLMITTNRYENCPNLKLEAVGLFYKSNSGYVGADSVSFVVTFENGQSQAHSFTVLVEKEIQASNAEKWSLIQDYR